MPTPDRPARPVRGANPTDILASLAVGTRVVVRYRIEGGLTDALGELVRLTDSEATIRTRHGDATVRLDSVVAAKPVPPPPARRHTPSENS